MPPSVFLAPSWNRGLFANITPVTSGTVQSTEYTLQTATLLANTLANDGDTLQLDIMLTTAANANSKTIRVKFGDTQVFTQSTTTDNNAAYAYRILVVRLTATTQLAYGTLLRNGASVGVQRSTPAETLAGDVAVAVISVNNAAAAASATSEVLRGSYWPANPSG